MSIAWVKDIKMYTRGGKYCLSSIYRISNDNQGWRTNVKEFDTEEERYVYVLGYNDLEYGVVPHSFYDKALKASYVEGDAEASASRFYDAIANGLTVYTLDFNSDSAIKLKTVISYSSRYQCYTTRYKTLRCENNGKVGQMFLYTWEEVQELFKNYSGSLESSFTPVLYKENYRG